MLLAALATEAAAARKWWTLQANSGFVSDRNINRLLINSTSPSHRRRPDVAYRSGAGLALRPFWSRAFRSEISYNYGWNDYRENSPFDYGTHALSLDVYPALARRLSLEAGGDGNWTYDRQQTVAESVSGHGGLIWAAPGGWGYRAGYEYRTDNVRVNARKDAVSHIGYISVQKGLFAKQKAFLSYRYRFNNAAGPDFTYRSHGVTLGLLNPWTSWFRFLWMVDATDKHYAHRDTRFRLVRRDVTYTGTVKATLSLLSFASVFAGYSYIADDSNVGAKDYAAQTYASGLEVKF